MSLPVEQAKPKGNEKIKGTLPLVHFLLSSFSRTGTLAKL